MGLKYGGAMEWDVIRVLIALRFQGWTLDYIDGLGALEVMAIMQVLDGKAKAETNG